MPELDTFIETCTNGVHPSTVAAIIEIVTARDPFIMSVLPANGKNYRAAASDARTVIEKGTEVIMDGGEVSVGLMQVNSVYWLDYDVTVMDMMDPCTNIQVGSSLFADTYKHFLGESGNSSKAMRAALEAYIQGNTFEVSGDSVVKLFSKNKQNNVGPIDRSSWSAEIRVAEFYDWKNEELQDENKSK